MEFDLTKNAIVGPLGSLTVREDDELTRKLLMLIEGECEGMGPSKASEKHNYSRQRYTQLRRAFLIDGADALISKTRGPKTQYRCTSEIQRQVIRFRFLDSRASADVIAQKLKQQGFMISARSVQRIIAHYGLQKKSSLRVLRSMNVRPLSKRK